MLSVAKEDLYLFIHVSLGFALVDNLSILRGRRGGKGEGRGGGGERKGGNSLLLKEYT